MAGFTSAEGCFKITLVKRPNRKIDQVYLVFQITQHSRDERLLESFIISAALHQSLKLSSFTPKILYLLKKVIIFS